MADWHLYVVRAADDSLYTGIATDVERRLAEHREGMKGAKYLRGRGPLELVFQCRLGERGLALRVERWLKKLPKAKKEEILAGELEREDLLRLVEAH